MIPWVAVDWNSCLAPGEDYRTVGAPYPEMVRLVRRMARTYEVKLFTAWASHAPARPVIRRWLRRWKLPIVKITDRKDRSCVAILDDRATRVRRGHCTQPLIIKSPCGKVRRGV